MGFGSVKQNSQCSPRKTKEFFYILKTDLKTPPPSLCIAANVVWFYFCWRFLLSMVTDVFYVF